MNKTGDLKMTQLYASIKKGSKYYGQTSPGELFEIRIVPDGDDPWVVKGGPGGQYWLSDVSLFVVSNNKKIKIS